MLLSCKGCAGLVVNVTTIIPQTDKAFRVSLAIKLRVLDRLLNIDARLSWVDCEDVAAVATACLLDPEKHNGQTYRLGYEARTYYGVAEIFTQVIGQPFSYEPRPPEEFYRNGLSVCRLRQ